MLTIEKEVERVIIQDIPDQLEKKETHYYGRPIVPPDMLFAILGYRKKKSLEEK